MVQDSEGYILYPANYPEHKIRKIHARKPHIVFHHVFMYKNEASMLGNLTLFFIMYLCIKMRLLALGIPLILNCVERKFPLHQMNIMSLLRLLMHHMF
jgi:hypothetical protein